MAKDKGQQGPQHGAQQKGQAPQAAVDQLAQWAGSVGDGAPEPRPPWVILIDGHSGSGKTHFAGRLLQACARSNPQLVHLEDFYPGWGGLFAAATMVAADVLHPKSPGFRRWDWEAGTSGTWQQLDLRRPMIIEGVGALSPASIARLKSQGIPHRAVVVGAPTRLRKHRALSRDPYYGPWWDMWAAQERAHIARRPAPDIAVANY